MKTMFCTYRIAIATVLGIGLVALTACKSKQSVVPSTIAPLSLEKTEVSKFKQAEQMAIDNAFLEGVKQMAIEDYNTALGAYLDVLRMDNEHAPANFEISKIKLMQNQPSEAEIYAERACRLSPQNKFYFEHLAYIYRQNKKDPQALGCFEHLTKLDPKNEDYLLEMANSYLILQKPLDAIRIYDSLEKRQGISDELSMQKIKIYQAMGKESNVRETLQKLTRKFPNETKYWSILAELNMQAKKYKEAFSDYQKILAFDPENPYIHLSLADYYRVMRDTTKILEELILAFENPKLDVDSKVTLILPFYNQPQRKKGTYSMLDAVLLAHPSDPKALALYADFLQRDDRYAEAREKYLEVIKLNASKYPVWEALLFCDLNLLDTTALLDDAQNALERFPEQPLVYYMLGMAYNLKSDYAMAMQYFEQGAALSASNPRLLAQFYSNLGDIYHHLNNHKKSDENYQKALEIEPENVLVLNNFAYFLALRKDQLDKAEAMARLCCQKNPNNPTYLDTFAWVLYQQGKYKDAKAIMELALQYGGEKEAALLEHYGDILWKDGNKEQALKLWKQAFRIDEKACSDLLKDKIKAEQLIEN